MLRIILAILLLVVIHDNNQSMAEEKGMREIHVTQINEDVYVIGKLGKPLGTGIFQRV